MGEAPENDGNAEDQHGPDEPERHIGVGFILVRLHADFLGQIRAGLAAQQANLSVELVAQGFQGQRAPVLQTVFAFKAKTQQQVNQFQQIQPAGGLLHGAAEHVEKYLAAPGVLVKGAEQGMMLPVALSARNGRGGDALVQSRAEQVLRGIDLGLADAQSRGLGVEAPDFSFQADAQFFQIGFTRVAQAHDFQQQMGCRIDQGVEARRVFVKGGLLRQIGHMARGLLAGGHGHGREGQFGALGTRLLGKKHHGLVRIGSGGLLRHALLLDGPELQDEPRERA